MYLLDTNVVSELRKGDHCDERVSAWSADVEIGDTFISVLTLGEVRKGIEQLRNRDPRQARVFERWLHDLERRYAGRILFVDGSIADAWGQMYGIRNVSVVDGLLAATAKVNDLALVTRNTSDVEGLGVQTLNPFLEMIAGDDNG